MRIACIDSTAAAREELRKWVEGLFDQTRHSLGSFTSMEAVAISKDQIGFDRSSSLIVFGPGFSEFELLELCRELDTDRLTIPRFIVFPSGRITAGALERLSRIVQEILSFDDLAPRVVHRFLQSTRSSKVNRGKLVTVSGAKGGVGVTSFVAGLAHGCQAVGRLALSLDLTLGSPLLHYCRSNRTHSPEWASALTDQIAPNGALLDSLIVEAPNGLQLVLPPAGGLEVREKWLRDSSAFELLMSTTEALLERCDVLIVDVGCVEGIGPFALRGMADRNIIVTNNDPASLYGLLAMLEQSVGGESLRREVLINSMIPGALSAHDVESLLTATLGGRGKTVSVIGALSYERSVLHWMGNGNTPYTEGSSFFRRSLESIAREVCDGVRSDAVDKLPAPIQPLNTIKRICRETLDRMRIGIPTPQRKSLPALPAPAPSLFTQPNFPLAAEAVQLAEPSDAWSSLEVRSTAATYSPPVRVVAESRRRASGDAGTLSLEYSLMLVAIMMLFSTVIPFVWDYGSTVVERYQETGNL